MDNAIICHISFIHVIWYFLDKDMHNDKFVKFHVKQGIILFLAGIVYAIALNIAFSMIKIITLGLLESVFWGLFSLLSLVPWVFIVLGIINALNKNEKELPIIGKYAEKLTF